MNRLDRCTSLYLKQHANHPVSWHPWNQETLQLAKDQGKPIFLSIGYSSCHWCHVMAHECFEDEALAQKLNDAFICIKVDKEERPELDHVYQLTHQLLTGRAGGWPLSAFLDSANLLPVYCATYLPKYAKHQLPAFGDVIDSVQDYFQNKPQQVEKIHTALNTALLNVNHTRNCSTLSYGTLMERGINAILGIYDARQGGFYDKPKFPCHSHMSLLVDTLILGQHENGLETIVNKTLLAMGKRGLYDQIGGGFFRYCVDESWTIPHFEKMLYDNGQMLTLYSRATSYFNNASIAKYADETAQWLMTEMRLANGAFSASVNADSSNEEGSYYLWQRSDLENILTDEEIHVITYWYGLNQPANFNNLWHLIETEDSINELSKKTHEHPRHIPILVDAARFKMRQHRDSRCAPVTDRKIIVSWNALVIKGLAQASQAINNESYLEAAGQCVDFIYQNCWDKCYLSGTFAANPPSPGLLNDYVFMIDALYALLQARWRDSDFYFACALINRVVSDFYCPELSGFYLTPTDHEPLIQKQRILHDESVPSAYALMCQLLLKFSVLTGEEHYRSMAEAAIKSASYFAEKEPSQCPSLLSAIRELNSPSTTVVIRGQNYQLFEWRQAISQEYSPNRSVFCISNTQDRKSYLKKLYPLSIEPVAYVCGEGKCLLPITTKEALVATIQSGH